MSGDNTGSETEVTINTVATLSKDVFATPCEDQNNLECPHLTDAISGLDNEIPQSEENATPQSSDFTRFVSVSTTDEDLSNVATTPAPIVLSHRLLPDSDPDCSQSSSMGPSQSSSRMHDGRGYRWQCKRQSTSSHSALYHIPLSIYHGLTED